MRRDYVLQRFSDNRQSTLGVLVKITDTNLGKRTVFQGYTLEDQFNEVKIQKETRIPAGRYEIVINRTETPKTKAYQVRYNWFKNHLQLANVPGFQGIYIHVGNTEKDTDGCILIADNAGNNVIGDNGISSSTECFRRFYSDLYSWLDHQESEGTGKPLKYVNTAFIHILDEKLLIP